MQQHSEKKGLSFNIKKTLIMDVQGCFEPSKVKVNDEEIERVKSV